MKTATHILLLHLLLLSLLAGCIDNTFPQEQEKAYPRFEAEYRSDSGHARKMVLGSPSVIADHAGERGRYLPLLATTPVGLNATHWLDRDHRLVRADVHCSDTHDDECIQDGLIWVSAGGPAPLCLDLRDLVQGEHEVAYLRAGRPLNAIVTVAQEAEEKVVSLRPEGQGTGLRERTCTFLRDEPAPVSYRERSHTWERQSLELLGQYEPTDLDVPLDQDHPVLESGVWFPGDEKDHLEVGMSPREILAALLEENSNAESKIEGGGCLSYISVDKVSYQSKIGIPGEKLAEGKIRIMTNEGDAHQWIFNLHRGATSTELASREVAADPAPHCNHAADPVMSLEEATEASLRAIEKGSMTSFYYDVRLPPHMSPEAVDPRPHFITAFRPDYVPTGPGTFSYKPYSLYFDASQYHLVSANLHPSDVERFDAGQS